MKTLKIGIAGYDRMKVRTVAIARGEHKPASGDPTVWFTSVCQLSTVDDNTRLIWWTNWATVRRPIRVFSRHVGLAIP